MGFEGGGEDLADEAEDVLGIEGGGGDAAEEEEVVVPEFRFVSGEIHAGGRKET